MTPEDLRAMERVFLEAVEGVGDAHDRHGAMSSPHEGYAIILEELDELWDHVKANTCRTPEARAEAIQVAVSALRFAASLTT